MNLADTELKEYPEQISLLIDSFISNDINKEFFFAGLTGPELLDDGHTHLRGPLANVKYVFICNGFVVAHYDGKAHVFDHSRMQNIRVKNVAVKFPSSDQEKHQE